MFYICIFWTSSSLFGAVYVFPFEKDYLVKDRTTDMYRLSVYYICSMMCDMVAHILYPVIFMSIVYFMAGTLWCVMYLTNSTIKLPNKYSIYSVGIRVFYLVCLKTDCRAPCIKPYYWKEKKKDVVYSFSWADPWWYEWYYWEANVQWN